MMLKINAQRKTRVLGEYLFLLLLLIAQFNINGQEDLGRPFITNYSYKDYQAGPINWWAIEDDRGIMYFANDRGVLQYDGANWILIESANKKSARCFAKDDDGIIYVGFIGDIGYLDANEKGEIKIISLRDKLPKEHQVFLDVWEVDYWKGDIIFRTSEKLFRWNGQKMDVITADGDFHVGQIVNDKYYIRIWNRGLCAMEGDSFPLVPGGEQFSSERIYVIQAFDQNRLLIGTRTQGFFIYDGQHFIPFKTEADDYIQAELYLPGLNMGDGRFLLNTFSNGAYVINQEGKLLQKITRETGLQDNSVTNVFVDSRGVLWLTLFNGISSIKLDSHFRFLGESTGLPSIVFRVIRHQGILYAGTNNGTYYYDSAAKSFKLIKGTFGQTSDFVQHQGRLFAGSGGMGFFEILGTGFEYVRADVNYDFRVSQLLHSQLDSNRIYVDLQDGGMASLYFDDAKGQFEEESRTARGNPDIGGFAEDIYGNIWTDGPTDGQISVFEPLIKDAKLDLNNAREITYDSSNGLPNAPINFWKLNGTLEFFSGTETYTFDEKTQKFNETGLFYEELYEPNAYAYPRPKTDQFGRTWFGPGKGVVVSSQSSEGTNQLIFNPFLEIKNFPIWDINIDENSTEENTIAWFTGPDGIVRYEGNLEAPEIPDFHVLMRHLSVAQDSLLYAGETEIPMGLKISHDDNTVKLGYSSPFYIAEDDLEYQTFLEGLDKNWSTWTSQSERSYINLPTGNYNFKVRARNIYGLESEETSFSFSILPPWYQTWWAYLLYLAGAGILVYAIVRSRTDSLRKQQRILEETVSKRTKEVQQRVDELATVNSVSQVLTEKLEFGELVKLVGEKMKELFKANISYLAILDPTTQIINFPYQDGDVMEPLKYGEGLTSKIIASGEPMLINHDISREYDELGIQRVGKNAASYLGVPIPVEGKVMGVLSVQSTEKENRFDENDLRLLSTIAGNVGIALHNAELYEEARAAKAQAEDANEAKSAFLSTVSHELRTPLTSVLGFAKIIRKRLEDRIFPAVEIDDQKIKRAMKQVSENLGVVISEGERLTTLINDVLDLAKIESGRMDWNMKPIFIQDVISRAISATASLFENKKLALTKNIAPDLPLVSADQDKLIQVMINLLSNAVKFTDKGKVMVEAYQDKGQIIIEVQDTGIGVAEHDKHKVFERFRQAGDTLTDKPQGTGLGLPICREIIEHHGGIIWMKSELGIGSTFFFSIPVLGDSAPGQPIHLERIVRSLKKQIDHTTTLSSNDSRTILVVDDDTPIRSLLRQELSDAGYQVIEAANGKAALDMVRLQKPDLILLDVMMPEINGFDVAAVLKNDPDTMDIPIIILSIVQDQERGFRIGVDRYLTKPIDTERLFLEVDALLEQGVSKKKVLVVDEDISTIKALSEVLGARGYKVMEANGKDLIETAVKAKPDIIMLNSLFDGDREIVKTLKFQKGMENVLFFVYQ